MTVTSKVISPAAINALKDALTHIYWTKDDLKRFVYNTIANKAIVSTIDWATLKKYESASQLVDRMSARPDMYKDDLFSLFEQVVNFNDFSHLKRWDDPEIKIKRAKDAVEALRGHAKGYFEVAEEKKKTDERKKVVQEKVKNTTALKTKLDELNHKFMEIATSSDAQKRGYGLEKLLNELFTLFDLDPKASFKITGEQLTVHSLSKMTTSCWRLGGLSSPSTQPTSTVLQARSMAKEKIHSDYSYQWMVSQRSAYKLQAQIFAA